MSEDKNAIITARLNHTRSEFLGLVVGLSDDQWQIAAHGDESDWRVVDVLRHLADSERGMTNLIEQIRNGGEGVPPDFDLDRWNRRAVSKLQDKTPQEIIGDMAKSRATLLTLIDTLTDYDWEKKGRHASLKIMSIEEICHLIADHEHFHVAGIRESLTR